VRFGGNRCVTFLSPKSHEGSMQLRKWKCRMSALAILALAGIVSLQIGAVSHSVSVNAQETPSKYIPSDKGGEGDTGPYEVVRGWPQKYHDEGWTWGRSPSVVAVTPNRIVRIQSGELPVLKAENEDNHPAEEGMECCVGGDGIPIRQAAHPELGGRGFAPHEHKQKGAVIVFDGAGKVIERWEQWDKNIIGISIHRITMDPYDPTHPLWICAGPSVYKFSADGKKLLLRIGGDKPGKSQTELGGATDLAIAPNGDIYIADSRKNARIIKFAKDGKYLMEFGKPGSGPGEFNNTHSLALGPNERLYVADRENSRIQVFDGKTGKHLDTWPNIWNPDYVGVAEDGAVWVADDQTAKILKYSPDGYLQYSWGTLGGKAGHFYGQHHLATDSEGNLYTTDVYSGRTQKFRPKKGADPNHLIKGVLRGKFQ